MSVTLKYADRVLQTTMTTGEGPFALMPPPPGFRSVSATIGVGVAFRCVVDLPGSDEFVLCQATVDGSDILTLGTILQSSNGGAAVAFPDGEKRVMVVLAAEDIPVLATDGSLDLLGRVSAADGGYFQGANPLAAGLWTEVGTASGGGFLRAITRGTNVLASMLYDAASHAWKAASTTVMQLSSTALSVGIGVGGFALIVGSADPGGSQALRIGGTMHASGAAAFDASVTASGLIGGYVVNGAGFDANSAGVSRAGYRWTTNSTNRWELVVPSASSAMSWQAGGVTEVMSLTSGGALTVASTITAGPNNATSTLQLGPGPASNAGGNVIFNTSNTLKKFEIGFNLHNSGALDFTASTAIGGTAFATPIFSLFPTSIVAGADPGGAQLLRVGGTQVTNGLLTLNAGAAINGGMSISGIAATVSAAIALNVSGGGWLAGAGQFGILSAVTPSSAATSSFYAGYFQAASFPAAYTQTLTVGVFIDAATKGAGSTLTSLYGLFIASQAGAGTNYAIYTNAGTVQFGDNLALWGTGSFGGGTLVAFLANRSAAPSTNPVGGGIMYAEAGALKWRGSSGTVTAIAPA